MTCPSALVPSVLSICDDIIKLLFSHLSIYSASIHWEWARAAGCSKGKNADANKSPRVDSGG